MRLNHKLHTNPAEAEIILVFFGFIIKDGTRIILVITSPKLPEEGHTDITVALVAERIGKPVFKWILGKTLCLQTEVNRKYEHSGKEYCFFI